MSVTITNKRQDNIGSKKLVTCDVTFDSSYASGGESPETGSFKTQLGLTRVTNAILGQVGGYSYEYDYTNHKIKVYSDAYMKMPKIVYSEHHVADSTTKNVTTTYPPAFIMAISTPRQGLLMRSTGVTPGVNECALTAVMATGEVATIKTYPAFDELLGKGTFTGAADGFTCGTGWAYSSNTAVRTANATLGTLTANLESGATNPLFTPVVGRTYRFKYTVTPTAGAVVITCGGCTLATITYAAGGAWPAAEVVFTATTTGGLTFTPNAACACTVDNLAMYCEDVYVTYVTQAWEDVWNNLVQDETVTLSSSAATDSSYPVLALMYVDRTSTTAKAMKVMDQDDTVASGAIPVYFGQTLGVGTFKQAHADENAKVVKYTYVKKPLTGFLSERAFANEAATLSVYGINTLDYPVLLWGYGGLIPTNGGNTKRIIRYSEKPGAGDPGTATSESAVVDWFSSGLRNSNAPATGTTIGVSGIIAFTSGTKFFGVGEIVTGSVSGSTATVAGITIASGLDGSNNIAGTLSLIDASGAFQAENLTGTTTGAVGAIAGALSYSTVTGAGVWGKPWEIPTMGIREVPNGTDLSSITIPAVFVGF